MSLWYGKPSIAELKSVHIGSLATHLGIEISEIGADFLRGTMPVDERTRQPHGLLHGGASLALAETLGSVAATLTLDPRVHRALGQEINANHLRPVTDGLVTGTARPFHVGARSQVWGVEVHDGRGRLICVSRITMAIVGR